MLYHISKLHHTDQELIRKAPLLVSILVAGADGVIEHEEIEKAVSLIHTKSFSEASDIRHLYKDIDHDVEETLDKLLKGLPSDAKEREKIITAELEQLNHVMTKLDGQVALDFYNSLRNFAVHVAQTSGGVFGMLKLNFHEKEVVKLPMLAKPSH
jgi:hypothetical protein